MGIKKQNINLWLRDESRKIPKKYLPILSEIFGGLDERYFQKELDEVDQIEIQQKKIRNELVEYEYEYPDIDSETGEEVIVYGTQVDQEQEFEDKFLEFKKQILMLHKDIDNTLSDMFTDGKIDVSCYSYGSLIEATELLDIYEKLVGILKRNNIHKDTVKKVLKGLINYEGKHWVFIQKIN